MKKKIFIFITMFFIFISLPKAEELIKYDWTFTKINYNKALGLNNVLVKDNKYYTWHINTFDYINVINEYDESGKLIKTYEPSITEPIVDLIYYDKEYIAIDRSASIYKLDNNFNIVKQINNPEKINIINDKSELKIANNMIYYIDKFNYNIFSTDYSLNDYKYNNVEDKSLEEILHIVPFISETDKMYFKYILNQNEENELTDLLKIENKYYLTGYNNDNSFIKIIDDNLNVLWEDNSKSLKHLKLTMYNDYLFILSSKTIDNKVQYVINIYNSSYKQIKTEELNLDDKTIPISLINTDNGMIVKSIIYNDIDNLNLFIDDIYDEIYINKYNINIYNIRTIVKGEGAVDVKSSAIPGDIVSFSLIPADGYILDKLSIKDSNGNSLPVSDYTFIMPSSDVTITAHFTPKNPNTTDNISYIIFGFILSLDILVFTIYQYKRCKN